MTNVLNANNVPTAIRIDGDYLYVTLVDKRVVALPLDRVEWLKNATPDQQQDYRIFTYSMWWEGIDAGIDMEWLLLGDYETAQEGY
jgi:hypothetical protein